MIESYGTCADDAVGKDNWKCSERNGKRGLRGEGKGASTRSPNSKKFRALAKASVLHARAKKKHEKGDVSPMSVLADFE